MSKVFCKDCKLIYNDKDVEKLHQLCGLKGHE